MNEFMPPITPATTPEIEGGEKEPTVAEIVDFALKDGLIDTDERHDMEKEDIDTVLGDLAGIISEDGGDFEEVFARWGILAEAQES